MSKVGRKTRPWHYQRILQEFEELPETIISEMFAEGYAISVIAGALDVSYGEMHEWIKELGLRRDRPAIATHQRQTVKRLQQEHGHNYTQLICSDRANGMKYKEITAKYQVSNGFVAACLHQESPWLIGTHDEPITVAPPDFSPEVRELFRQNCIRHNQEMKQRKAGWFEDMSLCFVRRP